VKEAASLRLRRVGVVAKLRPESGDRLEHGEAEKGTAESVYFFTKMSIFYLK
jgi:hypothetical protein